MSARAPCQGGGARLGDDLLFEIAVPARANRLQVIRATVDWAAGEAGFQLAARESFVLAVDEACQNVIRHGYGGDCDQPLRVRAQLVDDTLVVRVIDRAPTIDPERIQPRPLDDVRPGGLGTRLMHDVLDEVVYEDAGDDAGAWADAGPRADMGAQDHGGNVLKLVKRLERGRA